MNWNGLPSWKNFPTVAQQVTKALLLVNASYRQNTEISSKSRIRSEEPVKKISSFGSTWCVSHNFVTLSQVSRIKEATVLTFFLHFYQTVDPRVPASKNRRRGIDYIISN